MREQSRRGGVGITQPQELRPCESGDIGAGETRHLNEGEVEVEIEVVGSRCRDAEGDEEWDSTLLPPPLLTGNGRLRGIATEAGALEDWLPLGW